LPLTWFSRPKPGYFDAGAETKPLLHLWSLGIEEQFYLVWPIIAVLVFRRQFRASVVLSALGAASLGLYLLAWHFDPVLAFYLLPARFWEILAGAGLAYYERSGGAATPGVGLPLAAVGLILVAAFGLDAGALPAHLLPLVAVAAALMIILPGGDARIPTVALASRPVVFVGLISYPLYLWHWPLLSFARLAVPEGEPLAPSLVVSALVAAFVLATLTWLLVERPLRTRVFPIERNRKAAGACLASGGAALTLLAALGAATLAMQGLPGRLEGFLSAHQVVESEVQWQRKHYVDAECQRTEGFHEAPLCRRSGGRLAVAVIGDSHANQLMPGLLDVFGSEAIGVIHVGEGGCPGLPGVRVVSQHGKRMCPPDFHGYLDFVISNAEIRHVLIASRVSLYADPTTGYRLLEDGAGAMTAQQGLSNAQALARGYSNLIATLRAAGKEVIVVSEAPRLSFHPRDCVARRPFGLSVRTPCSQAADTARLEASEALIKDAAEHRPELESLRRRRDALPPGRMHRDGRRNAALPRYESPQRGRKQARRRAAPLADSYIAMTRASSRRLASAGRIFPAISASGVVTVSPLTIPTSTPCLPPASASTAAAPRRVASTRSAALGIPPRTTWPRRVTRRSKPIDLRCSP
jgi:hypothetical protein